MKNISEKLTVVLIIAIFAFGTVACPKACTQPDKATKILSQQGYKDIVITGWRPFSEVGNMRHTLAIALNEHQLQLDEYMRKAIEDFCQPEKLEKIITDIAHKELNNVIQVEVERFFKFGEGHKAVSESVRSFLLSGSLLTQNDKN